MSKSKPIESYQALFAIGIFVSIYALILLAIDSESILLHSRTLLTGFFMAFILGFMLSMGQYMLQIPPATKTETYLASALVLLSLYPPLFNITLLAELGFLIFFLAQRIAQTRRLPGGNFIYLPFAFFLVPISVLLHFPISVIYELLLLNFIIGVGSKMVPIISRTQTSFSPAYVESNRFSKHVLSALTLNLVIMGDFYFSSQLFSVVRAGVLSFIIIVNFQLLRPLSAASTIGHGLRLASWLIVGAQWFILLPYGTRILWLHVMYIGGFLLLTLLVAARVISSQYGIPIRSELNSMFLRGAYLSIAMATLSRVGYGLTNERVLFYASVVLCLSGILCLGCQVLFPGVARQKTEPSH